MRDLFREDLTKLVDFVESSQLGAFTPTQVEIAYVNQLGAGYEGLSLDRLVKTVSPSPASIGDPEGQQYRARYVIGNRLGRLHILAATGPEAGVDVRATINLTARGAPTAPTIDGVIEFLEAGSTAATDAFDALITDEMAEKWGRYTQ